MPQFDPRTAKKFDPTTAKAFDPSTAQVAEETQFVDPIQTSPYAEIGNQIGGEINQASRKIGRGSYVAGGAQAGNAALQTALSPFSYADTGIRQATGAMAQSGNPMAQGADAIVNLALDALGLIPKAGSAIGSGLTKAGLGYAGLVAPNLGTTPQNAQEIRTELPKLAGTVGSIIAPTKLSQASRAVGVGAEKFGVAREASQIKKAGTEIKKVAPPQPKELNYDQALNRATPYIAEQARLTPLEKKSDISQVRQTTELLATAKDRLWNEKITPQLEAHPNEVINGTEIAAEIRKSIPEYTKRTDPKLAQSIEDYAQTFDGNISLAEANSFIKELNAKTSAYQKSPPTTKALMETMNPKLSSEITAVNALRDVVYKKLGELGERNVIELRKDYGALAQIHKAMERNIVKAEKDATSQSFYGKPFGTAVAAGATMEGLIHAPITTSLAGTIGFIRRTILQRNKPNPTVNRAIGRLEKSKLEPR
jgi:hypothetical protein